MGQKDLDEWPFKRDRGCTCDYCAGGFNYCNEYTSSGAIGRKLKDGEIQIEPRNGGALYITAPGCLKTKAIHGYTGNGFSAEILPDKPKEVKQVMVYIGHPVICRKCGLKNDHGGPNQKDGGYLCYECR